MCVCVCSFFPQHIMPENKIYIKKNKTEAQPLLHTSPQISMIYVTGLIIKSTT